MKEKLLPFVLGAILASGGTIALQAVAASGDVKYETLLIQQCITAGQAACYADCAIADGTWDGARTDLIRVQARRYPECGGGVSNFIASVRGNKTAPLANVPDGSIFRGVAD